MSRDIRTSVLINLGGNLATRARQFQQALSGFSADGRRSMGVLAKATSAVGQGLDRLGNRYTALITGAAGAGTVRTLVQLEARMVDLGIKANTSAEDMERLKKQVFSVAQAAGIRVSPDQILDAIDGILEKTGDLKFAEENIRNIGIAIGATGAAGKDIGDLFAEIEKQGVNDPKKVLEIVETLNEQGKAGAFTLQNLAALGPRVVSAYTGAQRISPDLFREMGAVLQVIRQGTGSSEQAATSFEAIMRTFRDADKVKMLREGGIQVFEPGSLEKGQPRLRAITDLLVEIVEKVKGNGMALGGVFDDEAMRGMNVLISEYVKNGGKIKSIREFMDTRGTGKATENDAARRAKTAAAALTYLGTVWRQFADQNLTAPIQAVADALNSLEPESAQRWLKIGAGVASVLGALIVARKLYTVGSDLAGMLKPGGTVSGAGGLSSGGIGNVAPIPVYVVNMGGATNGIPGGGQLPGGGGKLTVGSALAAAPQLALAFGGGMLIGDTAYKLWGKAASLILGREESFGGILADLVDSKTRAVNEMNGRLDIRIDSEGRPRVTSMSASDGLDLDVSTGPMFPAGA